MDQALDLARRRDYPRAQQKFRDAEAKYRKEGSILYVNLANAYAQLMSYPSRGNDPTYLLQLASFMRATLGETEIRPGPRGISAATLATQLELAATETTLLGQLQSGAGDRSSQAQALQVLANGYRQLRGQVLFLPELFNQQSISSESKFPVLMALSFETLGQSIETTDPLAAAEHFQTARQYWVQAGDQARANASASRVENLSFRAKCWFCGREGIGHGVQFVSMPIDQEVTGLKGLDTSPLPSLDGSGRRLYACKGCNSAIRLLADSIASQRVYDVELRLNARIALLESQIASLSRDGR